MAASVVQRNVNVLNARLDELILRLFHALAVVADGVVRAGDEIDGQVLGNGMNSRVRAGLFYYTE